MIPAFYMGIRIPFSLYLYFLAQDALLWVGILISEPSAANIK